MASLFLDQNQFNRKEKIQIHKQHHLGNRENVMLACADYDKKVDQWG